MEIRDNRTGETTLDNLENGEFFEYLNFIYLMVAKDEVYDSDGTWVKGESVAFNIKDNVNEDLKNNAIIKKLKAYITIE